MNEDKPPSKVSDIKRNSRSVRTLGVDGVRPRCLLYWSKGIPKLCAFLYPNGRELLHVNKTVL